MKLAARGLLLLLGLVIFPGNSQDPPKAKVIVVSPERPFYPGDTVTLRCNITAYTDWNEYIWYRDNADIPDQPKNIIALSLPKDFGEITCTAWRHARPHHSSLSPPVPVYYHATPAATLTAAPLNPLWVGETIVLKCEVETLTGWRYKWYKGKSPVTPVAHSYRHNRTGNILAIKEVTESDQAQYWCQGERSTRPTISLISKNVSIRVSGAKPTPILLSDRAEQLFAGSRVTLTCELDLTEGWDFYWYKDVNGSSSVTQTSFNSYSFDSVNVSDGGQYSCRAGRGDPVYYTHHSNDVWVKVTDGDVILESPTQPLDEGVNLTLYCRYRTEPTNLTADFYKDGYLLQTQSTGQMNIPKVTKGHEGFYHCKHSEMGESLESWISVIGPDYTEMSASLATVSLIAFAGVLLRLFGTKLQVYIEKSRDGGRRNRSDGIGEHEL